MIELQDRLLFFSYVYIHFINDIDDYPQSIYYHWETLMLYKIGEGFYTLSWSNLIMMQSNKAKKKCSLLRCLHAYLWSITNDKYRGHWCHTIKDNQYCMSFLPYRLIYIERERCINQMLMNVTSGLRRDQHKARERGNNIR